VAADDRRPRRARGSLSREEILDAARRVVERDGIHGLSIPTVATHLTSGATSIYWYFRGKDALLAALVDQAARHVSRGIPPVGTGPWEPELVEYFVAYRDLLHEVPVYREMLAYRASFVFVRSPAARSIMRRLEDGLELLVGAGLAPPVAARAYTACANYTNGFVILQHAHGLIPGSGHRPPSPAGRGTAGPATGDAGVRLDDEQFRFGLTLIVTGIREEYGLPPAPGGPCARVAVT
jgi:AcrR family transcriptional regulator